MTFIEQFNEVMNLKKQCDNYRDTKNNNHAKWCEMSDNVKIQRMKLIQKYMIEFLEYCELHEDFRLISDTLLLHTKYIRELDVRLFDNSILRLVELLKRQMKQQKIEYPFCTSVLIALINSIDASLNDVPIYCRLTEKELNRIYSNSILSEQGVY